LDLRIYLVTEAPPTCVPDLERNVIHCFHNVQPFVTEWLALEREHLRE
jgi:hypothetical protein